MQAESERARAIGAKIRKIRLSRKMTQSELTGGELTRNMLSRIENGSALPSVGTLCFIASRLGIGAGYFLAEGGDEQSFIRGARIASIRKAFGDGNFEECAQLCGDFSGMGSSDDEIAFARSVSLLLQAVSFYRDGLIASAVKYAAMASSASDSSVYSGFAQIKQYCSLLTTFAEAAVSDTPPAEILPQITPSYLYIYTKLLYMIENGRIDEASVMASASTGVSPYREHISAKLALAGSDISEKASAVETLKSIGITAQPFVKYRICRDLEQYYRSSGDYKNAYECSNERLAIIDHSKL